MKISVSRTVDGEGKETITPTLTVESADDMKALLGAVESGATTELIADTVTMAEEAKEKALKAARRAFSAIERRLLCLRTPTGVFMSDESLEAQIVVLGTEAEFIQEQAAMALAQVREADNLHKAVGLWRDLLQKANLTGSGRRFTFDGRELTFAELAADNGHDEEVLAWMRTAEIGDAWPGVPNLQRIA